MQFPGWPKWRKCLMRRRGQILNTTTKIIIFLVGFLLVVTTLLKIVYFYSRHRRVIPHTPSARCMLEKVPLATRLPVYYVNLDRSKKRRRYIEQELAPLGKLTRIAAADVKNETFVSQFIETEGLDMRNFAEVIKSRPGEIGVTFSHMLAMREAIRKNQTEIIVFEDDASLLLYPFWMKSIDEIVDELSARDPTWESIQLNAWLPTPSYRKKISQEVEQPVLWQLKPGDKPFWGSAGMIYSVRAMNTLRDLLFNGSFDNKFDCRRHAKETNLTCVTENVFRSWLNQYVVYPPMIQQTLNEGSTGVRTMTSELTSDQVDIHYTWSMLGLTDSADACEASIFE